MTDRTIGLYSIDDVGRIFASGWEYVQGRYRDKFFFLTPVPEPAMIGVIVMVGVGLQRAR